MRRIVFIPRAYPLSDFDHEDGNAAEFSDNSHELKMYSDVNVDMHVLNLLSQLKDRHKIVLMYLLLRDNGFNFTHGECAKTMSLSRQAYMNLVKVVRTKGKKIMKGIK